MNVSRYKGHQNIKGRKREPKPDSMDTWVVSLTLLHMNKHILEKESRQPVISYSYTPSQSHFISGGRHRRRYSHHYTPSGKQAGSADAFHHVCILASHLSLNS